jgi:hypothetical protein
MSLASVCGYPPHYFDDLSADSDEDIEIERNDVRDFLRTVTGSGEGGSTSEPTSLHGPLSMPSRVLSKLVHSCNDAVLMAHRQGQLFPETAVHAFSSLAKPLNVLAKHSSSKGERDVQSENTLDTAMAMLCQICESTIRAFENRVPLADILPLSRLVDIAIASLSPMIAARCHIAMAGGTSSSTRIPLASLLQVVLEASILSVEHLPELAAESSLDHSAHDIRGTMRGPGGEDHVGCLAIMRITNESSALTLAVVDEVVPLIPRICKLHQYLKMAEQERGWGVCHGKGVTPQSRRILLSVLCHLELASRGRAGAASVLEELFQNALETIAVCGGRNSFDETTFFQMTESTFDLASFSPTIVSTLFIEPTASKTACLEALTSSCVLGYQRLLSISVDFEEATRQVCRVRSDVKQTKWHVSHWFFLDCLVVSGIAFAAH